MLMSIFNTMTLIIIILIFYDLQAIKRFFKTLKEEEK